MIRLVLVAVAVLVTATPADRPAAGIEVGRLGSRLALIPASPETRVETVVSAVDQLGGLEVDPAQSLIADPDVRALAAAFDSVGVEAAAFTTDVFRFMQPGAALLRYRAIATGGGLSRDGAYLAIGLAEPDEKTATTNAAALRNVIESGASTAARRPWSELLRVERIEARGRIVLAVLSTRVPTLWLDLERAPDTLLEWTG